MFISFEGTEGVGKSTLIRGVEAFLVGEGHKVLITREPGGTPVAEKLRAILINPDTEEIIPPESELLIFSAARLQNIQNKIAPALDDKYIVLSDRYEDSLFSYQVYGRGLPQKLFSILSDNFVKLKPDLTLWLDMPTEIAMARVSKRGELDRFEKEKNDFFKKVHQGYSFLHLNNPNRIKKINANQTPSEVLSDSILQIQLALTKKMGE